VILNQKSTMADLTLTIGAETSVFTTAIDKAKKGLESLAKVDLKELKTKLDEVSAKIKSFGAGLSSVGKFLTDNLTKPLTIGLDLATKQLDGKLKTLNDKVKNLFSKLFEPVIPYFEKGVDMLIGIVDKAIAWFENAPQGVRVFIAVIASIAVAIGPVITAVGGAITAIGGFVAAISAIVAGGTASVVIGAIAAAIAMLVAGIGIAIGVAYALAEAWQNGLGPIASYVALAIGGILTAFAPLIGIPVMIAALLVTLYEMWATNFGGIKDYTAQVWGAISEYINAAMAEIRQLVSDIGGDIVAWWNENYPLIEQTVRKTSDNLKQAIGFALAYIQSIWDAHGETIMSTVRSIWTIISTVVRTGVNVIMQVVRLVLQIINGDWAGAWNTAKDIVWRIITAIVKVLDELDNLVLQAFKAVLSVITGWGTDAIGKALEIGRNIVRGIIQGIGEIADTLVNYGRGLISRLFGAMNSEAETHSPSLVTTRMGMFIGEGLIVGLEAMTAPVAAAGKKMVGESLGQMSEEVRKARKEFDDYRGQLEANPQKGGDMLAVANYGDAKSKLDDLVKLRAELNMNVGDMLPATLHDINSELETLGKQKQGIEDARAMLEQMQEALRHNAEKEKTNAGKVEFLLADPNRNARIDAETQAELRRNAALLDARLRTEQYTEAKRKLAETGANTQLQMQGEINLLQAQIANNFKLSEAEAQRIRNQTEVEKYKADLRKDGFNDQEIATLAAALELQQRDIEVKRERIGIMQETIAAQQTYTGEMRSMDATLEQLNLKLAGNNELTEVARIGKLLETEAYKGLNEAQRENLRIRAQEIDDARAAVKAQEEAKKDFDKFKGFVKDSLDTLAKEGFGGFFKSIVEKFKKMLIDMASEWISSKLFELFFPDKAKAAGGGKGGGIMDFVNSVFGAFGFGKKKDSVAAPVTGGSNNQNGGKGGGDIGDAVKAAADARGLFDPLPNLAKSGKPPSALAGKLSGIGAIATMVGGFLPGKLGNVVSMAGMGLSIGANFGPWGAAIGAAAGAIIGLFMGDPKKKIDKKENMPKLQKGFTEAMQQLRDLLNDRNAIFSDPDGAIATATEIRGKIASGFGIEFQSKKYKGEAQKLIAAKLIEADGIIKQIKDLADVARMANKVDTRLETEFAAGIFADRAFIRRHADFKRRNGMLPGAFTGRDTLPSMLAPGEMVLNPRQIARVKAGAGFDVFRGAGIPNYASGTFVGGGVQASAVPVSVSPQPVSVQIVLNNSGLVESDIQTVLVDGLKRSDVQVELVKAYDKGKTRTRS
jgi:phage-related protein